MAAAHNHVIPRIVRVPGVQGGEPIVRDTRVPVRAFVLAWQAYGAIQAVLLACPRLTEAYILTALDYHDAHRDEMDEIIRTQLADV